MRRQNRKVTIFVWPGIAVTVIAVLLLWQSGWMLAPQSVSTEVRVSNVVSTNRAPRPRTLEADLPAPVAMPVTDYARRAVFLPERGEELRSESPRDMFAPPAAPPAAVSLHAPLLETNDELAGLDDQPVEAPVQSVAVTTARETAVTPALQRSSVGDQNNAWPATPALNAMLDEIEERPETLAWAGHVRQTLVALQSLDALGEPSAGDLLERLMELAVSGQAAAEAMMNDADRTRWLRVVHALHRRVATWQPVWNVTRRDAVQFASTSNRFIVDTTEVRRRADAVADACEATGDAEAWRYYLLLHRVSDAAQPGDAARRRITAQRLLSRIEWDGLTKPQRDWMQTPEVQDLAAAIRPWAAGPVDYTRLLQQLERQESDAIDLVGIDVAATTQTLRFAAGPMPQSVASAVNTYYRNANLRVAISSTLLNRLLPDVPDRREPVSQSIMGTRIDGTSEVQSAVEIRLVPNRSAWSLELLTDGQIRAGTVGRNGPVVVRNTSNATFQATTPLLIDAEGVELGKSEANVQQETVLRGLRTQYDGFPLIGSLVRGIAMSKYHETLPTSQRIAKRRMETQVADNIDEQLELQISEKTQQLTDQLLGPLARLRLAPTVVDLQTDDQRISARYRLAGDWQLAAFTPRPRAMSDSLLSMQVHQSAINNTFERLAPSEDPKSIRDVATEILSMFGQDTTKLPADIPDDIRVQFARTRPVTAEIDQDRLWLTFRIVRLYGDGGALDLRHFIVRASYRGVTEGLQARLERDGHLSIQGPRMSMGQRIAVRAIFNKVLHEDQPLPLTSDRLASHPATQGTRISQFEMRDGWIALAIAPVRSVVSPQPEFEREAEPSQEAAPQIADRSANPPVDPRLNAPLIR